MNSWKPGVGISLLLLVRGDGLAKDSFYLLFSDLFS